MSKGSNDQVASDMGMDGHSQSPNEHGGTHHTVYNDVTRISWDDDAKGNYVKNSFHEKLAPDTKSGHVWPGKD